MDIGNLGIKSPYNILSIKDIIIEHNPNKHGSLYLKCLVDDKINCNNTINSNEEDEICVYNKIDNTILFMGLVKNTKTLYEDDLYYLVIEGISYSSKLDVKIKSRSFQNINMTYKDIIYEVVKDYGKYDYTFEAIDKKIEKPIFQYKETDWEFILRLACDMEELVYSDIIKDNNLFYFGIKKGNNYEIKDNTYYKACKDLKTYYEVGGANSNYHDTDFFYYEISRKENYYCGDNIDFKNKKLYVSEYKGILDKSELIFKYKLCRKNGVWIKKRYNSLISGAIIEGEVLEVKDEKLKLHLDIDESQDVAEAFWFNYSPETCNVMYSMPKKGSKVGLYFPDRDMSEPKVINTLRNNREGNSNISDTSKRYLASENNKVLEMFPDSISFKGSKTGDLSISFDDDVGVTISSPSKLLLDASEEIIIRTPEMVEMNASNNIFIGKTDSNSGISIENEFHFLSNNVIQEGQDRETFSKYDDEPKAAEKPEKGFNWGALAIFAVAAVVTVATLGTGGILAGAIFGACVSVACTAVGDMISGETSSFKDYLLSAFSGAVCGAIFGPLKITGIFKVMGVGALEGGLDSLIRQLGSGEFSFSRLFFDMGVGAALSGLFYGLGKALTKLGPKVGRALKNAFNKAIPKIKSGLNSFKEGIEIRARAFITALTKNDVPVTRGLGCNGGNINPEYFGNFKKLYKEAKYEVVERVSKADLEINPFDESGKLKPNIKYKAGEYNYLYETDNMGRISKFETDNLQLTNRDSRLTHNANTPGKLEGDHAGHLAGDRFGGSPELDNLVSQSSNVNLSQYKKIENQWANAIKEGKNVKVNVEVKYDGDSLRPSEFNIKYEIDGKRYKKSILN